MKTDLIALERLHGANNYAPLDIVIARGSGVWLYDVEDRKYLDALSAYGAVNQGHRHPRIIAALYEQAEKLTLCSRAFRNEQLPRFCQELVDLIGLDVAMPMNTGAEAVETAIKAARRWGYRTKNIPVDHAEIIVCRNNFHGRTTTIVGFSNEPAYRAGFGPFTPGFVSVPFGSLEALAAAINPNTCAFLFEPIQAESGVNVPPPGYIAGAVNLCRERDVLSIADEIQTGLGRTGRMFAVDHESVLPDVIVLGKSLSGGVVPISAVVGRRVVMEQFDPGSHGSTFGGNPLACAVARAALRVVVDEELPAAAARQGERLLQTLTRELGGIAAEVRGKGLLIGIELGAPARPFCEALARHGVLAKETRDDVIRISPPLIIDDAELSFLSETIIDVLSI